MLALVGGGFWALGFIQGNASGSARIARANFIMHSATLKRFEDGDLDAARVYASMFVRTGDDYIHSSPFWWTALKEAVTIDNEETFARLLPLSRRRVQWAESAPKIKKTADDDESQNEER